MKQRRYHKHIDPRQYKKVGIVIESETSEMTDTKHQENQCACYSTLDVVPCHAWSSSNL